MNNIQLRLVSLLVAKNVSYIKIVKEYTFIFRMSRRLMREKKENKIKNTLKSGKNNRLYKLWYY